MEDMKLICAPFWDGDQLQHICKYFENYLAIPLKMINWNTSNFSNALTTSSTWSACSQDNIISQGFSQLFRVGRSWNWQSPHINFVTGTSCLQALNQLAQDTACTFVVANDGAGYFYELNTYGYPYYVDNQTNVVQFKLSDIININLRPQMQDKYNAVATFGFLVGAHVNKNSADAKTSVAPGSYYTKITSGGRINNGGNGTGSGGGSSYDDTTLSGLNDVRVNYPWMRVTLNVEQGYLTKTELLRIHCNRIRRAKADLFSGTIQVLGNTKVTHVYQAIKIVVPGGKIRFFVTAINHEMSLETKTWTTTYNICWTSLMKDFNTGGK